MLSLLGSLLGFGSAFLPKALGYYESKRDQAHELRLMDRQIAHQQATGAHRLEMSGLEAATRETEALHRSHASITRRASPWVISLSATVRPVMTYLLFVEFLCLTFLLAFNLIDTDIYGLIWSAEMQAVWAAVVSFWFGQRTFSRQ